MNITTIVGNACSLLAMSFNAISASRKTSKGVLWMQTISQSFYATGSIVLGGYSATVQNIVSILRNLAAMWKVDSKFLQWLFVAMGVVLGVAFNNRGWIGLLPVIGNLQYTLAIFRFQDDERKLKMFFLLSVVAFVIFNFAIKNYVGMMGDLFVFTTTSIMLLKTAKKKA